MSSNQIDPFRVLVPLFSDGGSGLKCKVSDGVLRDDSSTWLRIAEKEAKFDPSSVGGGEGGRGVGEDWCHLVFSKSTCRR